MVAMTTLFEDAHPYDAQCPRPACRARAARDEPTYRALVSVGRLLRGDFAREVLARADVEGLCGRLREYRGWPRSSFVVEVRGEAEALTRFARWFGEEAATMRLFVSARHRRNFWRLCAAVAGCALALAAALLWPVLGRVLLGLLGLALLALLAFVTWLVAMPSEDLYRRQVGRRGPGARWPWR